MSKESNLIVKGSHFVGEKTSRQKIRQLDNMRAAINELNNPSGEMAPRMRGISESLIFFCFLYVSAYALFSSGEIEFKTMIMVFVTVTVPFVFSFLSVMELPNNHADLFVMELNDYKPVNQKSYNALLNGIKANNGKINLFDSIKWINEEVGYIKNNIERPVIITL